MIGVLTLVGLLLVSAPGQWSHVLIGVVPDREFQVTVNSVQHPDPSPSSDSLGILSFTLVADCPCTVRVQLLSTGRPSAVCKESPR